MTEQRNEAAERGIGPVLPEMPEIPVAPGAYALMIDFHREMTVPVAGGARLAPGRYVYAGSAFGPGGIRARVSRHLRAAKALRWHVDHLRPQNHATAIIAVPGGDECSLVAAMIGLPGSNFPIPRFGASDCRNCAAHLIRIPSETSIDAIVRAIGRRRAAPIVIGRAGTTSLRRSLRPASR